MTKLWYVTSAFLIPLAVFPLLKMVTTFLSALIESALQNLSEDKASDSALCSAANWGQPMVDNWRLTLITLTVSNPSYLSLSGIELIISMTYKKTVLFSNGWGFNGQPKRSETISSILLPQHNSIQLQLHWQSFWKSAINLTAKTLALSFLHLLS